MFSYNWTDENGNNYKVQFPKGWQRLNSCKAATYHTMHITEPTKNALRDTVTHDTWYLISYGAPIAIVRAHHSDLLNNTNWTISLNEVYWNCSNTTIHHFSKFLAFVTGCPYRYMQVKNLMRSSRMHFYMDGYLPEVTDSKGATHNGHVYRLTPYAIKASFDRAVPYYD